MNAPNDLRNVLPAIGAALHDGLYAGLTIHDNTPMALVLLPGEFDGTWAKAKAWAEEQGGVLPSRIDQLVLFQRLKAEFKQSWYWSGQPYAGDDACAWGQYFDDGYQFDDRKDYKLHARAVRRLRIE